MIAIPSPMKPSLVILCLVLFWITRAFSEGQPELKVDPINAADLAKLLGIEKRGFRVTLPEKRHVRLVAEVTVQGKTRKEFITLSGTTQDFTMAVFTEQNPGSSSFRRLSCTLASENGAYRSRHFYDFRDTDASGCSVVPSKNGIEFFCSFKTYQNTKDQKIEAIGQITIQLETSIQPFPTSP
jgi:hypothetical protein